MPTSAIGGLPGVRWFPRILFIGNRAVLGRLPGVALRPGPIGPCATWPAAPGKGVNPKAASSEGIGARAGPDAYNA